MKYLCAILLLLIAFSFDAIAAGVRTDKTALEQEDYEHRAVSELADHFEKKYIRFDGAANFVRKWRKPVVVRFVIDQSREASSHKETFDKLIAHATDVENSIKYITGHKITVLSGNNESSQTRNRRDDSIDIVIALTHDVKAFSETSIGNEIIRQGRTDKEINKTLSVIKRDDTCFVSRDDDIDSMKNSYFLVDAFQGGNSKYCISFGLHYAAGTADRFDSDGEMLSKIMLYMIYNYDGRKHGTKKDLMRLVRFGALRSR